MSRFPQYTYALPPPYESFDVFPNPAPRCLLMASSGEMETEISFAPQLHVTQ